MAATTDRAARRAPRRVALLVALLAVGCGRSTTTRLVAAPSPAPTTSNHLPREQDAPGVVLEIVALSGASGPDGTYTAGDRIVVEWTAKHRDGSPWNLAELVGGALLVSGPTFNYQRVIGEQDDLLASSRDLGGGRFRYELATPIPGAYLPPLHDGPAFGAGDGELAGTTLLAGTYTVGLWCEWLYDVEGELHHDVGQSTRDFLYGGATTPEPREAVRDDNCSRCHTRVEAHGGSIRSVALCVLCHTSGAEDPAAPGVSLDFRVMIHKIHSGAHLPSVLGASTKIDGTRDYAAPKTPYVLTDGDGVAHDFSAVEFGVQPGAANPMPRDAGYSALAASAKAAETAILQGVTDCARCHGDPDGAGPLPVPAQGELHRFAPSRRACGSCHDDVRWPLWYAANGLTMLDQRDDTGCLGCHAPSGAAASGMPPSTASAHLHPLADPALQPGVNFAITAVGGATGSGGTFQAGDKPTISFSVKDDAGNDVALDQLDATGTLLVGPTTNRQHLLPYASNDGAAIGLPVDFAGRLQATSTTNKGAMSKVVGATVAEPLIVQFTSSTAFTLTGKLSGSLGGGTLPASTSTNATNSSLTSIELAPTAAAQSVTVAFTGSRDFTVSGSVTGAMGSGRLPAAKDASTKFVSDDGTLSFVVAVGSSSFANNNKFQIAVVKGGAANPVLFALLAGKTAFAKDDRFYYSTAVAAPSYTYAVPMELPLETLGNGSGAGGQVLTAANLPVYFGHQVLQERTALVGTQTTLSAAASARGRFVTVTTVDAGLAVGDFVVLDRGVGGKEEHLQVGSIDSTLKRIALRTPLRYDHAAATGTFQEATLTFRQEGVNYTLDPATGKVTSLGPGFGSGNAVVLSYRSDGRFGWLRAVGDSLQSVFVPPPNDSPDLGSREGEWSGLPLVDGTCTVAIFGRRSLVLGVQSEVQTYAASGEPGTFDVLYGTTTQLAPYAKIDVGDRCEACHSQVGPWHGFGRRSYAACALCHGVAGGEDWPIYASPAATQPTAGASIAFRQMLHKIHLGEGLENASAYAILGAGSVVHGYAKNRFPARPAGVVECRKCHDDGDPWRFPSPRQHPSQPTPTREWAEACSSCHDSASASLHFDSNTTGAGLETCATCHGPGASDAVDVVHKPR